MRRPSPTHIVTTLIRSAGAMAVALLATWAAPTVHAADTWVYLGEIEGQSKVYANLNSLRVTDHTRSTNVFNGEGRFRYEYLGQAAMGTKSEADMHFQCGCWRHGITKLVTWVGGENERLIPLSWSAVDYQTKPLEYNFLCARLAEMKTNEAQGLNAEEARLRALVGTPTPSTPTHDKLAKLTAVHQAFAADAANHDYLTRSNRRAVNRHLDQWRQALRDLHTAQLEAEKAEKPVSATHIKRPKRERRLGGLFRPHFTLLRSPDHVAPYCELLDRQANTSAGSF